MILKQLPQSEWDKLTAQEKSNFTYWYKKEVGLPTIADLIEFLGDDLTGMDKSADNKGWLISMNFQSWSIPNYELILALFEACLHKIRS